MAKWKKHLKHYESLLKELNETQKEGVDELKFKRSSIIASDVAQQFFCEKKVEMQYIHGRIITETKTIGTEAHEKMLEDSIAQTKPGIKAEDLEAVTGNIALEHGLGKNHTAAYGGPGTYLGHAIGLGVDEPPCLAKGDKTILKDGMVLTIEPGIYRTPFGGCRIEDEVLITRDGSETLNKDARKWWG